MANVNEAALDAIIQSYSDKVKSNPDSLLFVQLADAYRKKGDYDQALEVLRNGLARHNNLLSGLLMMGRIHCARKEYAEAVEVLRKVVQREPSNMTAHALLSQSFMSLGRWTDAIGEYQKILSLNPEDASAQAALNEALDRLRRAKAQPRPDETGKPAASAPPVETAPKRALDRPPAQAVPRAPMEAPAYAAAEELAARGLYEEAIEALQRILEADPDNFMARQKLREVYAQREAVETPSAAAAAAPAVQTDRPVQTVREVSVAAGTPAATPAAAPVGTQADKITDDEILYLLGLMEDASAAPAPAATQVAGTPPPKPEPPAAKPQPPAPKPEPPVAKPEVPAAPTAVEAPALSDAARAKVTEILNRFGATEGLRQAYFISGSSVVTTGRIPPADQFAKLTTLVGMLSDLTRRAAVSMKQGEVKQVLVFGTEGLVMVSPAAGGVLTAVAGGGINVGLLRIALNDCLKRLADVS